MLPSFSNQWVHLDTVSRQIFGDIEETQFSGSKMDVHVHLKNAFLDGIGNRRITFRPLFGLPPTPRSSPTPTHRSASEAVATAWQPPCGPNQHARHCLPACFACCRDHQVCHHSNLSGVSCPRRAGSVAWRWPLAGGINGVA